jgi:hypothetical protein
MKGQCCRCKKQITLENASSSVVRSGRGRCRLCEDEHAKKRSRTLGGKLNLGSAQAKYNGHKWELNFRQYAAIVALDECFYCGRSTTKGRGWIRLRSKWRLFLGHCITVLRETTEGCWSTSCNEMKSGEIPPILLFVRRWFEKCGQLPTEQDFLDRLQEFRTERDRTYKILCGLNSEGLKKLKRNISSRVFSVIGRHQ